MKFICQIKLTNDVIDGGEGKYAYIFMTDDPDEFEDTYDSESGENAVIIQPGGTPIVQVVDSSTGPYLINSDGKAVEYGLNFKNKLDPVFHPESYSEFTDDQREAYANYLIGCKIGGTPWFCQGDELPFKRLNGRFLMQLDYMELINKDSGEPFFELEISADATVYVFLDEDIAHGKLLWQAG
jgi:uncharacterized protein YwqG